MSRGVLQICLSEGWGGLEQYPLTLAPVFQAQGVPVFYWALEGSRFAAVAKERGLVVKTFQSRMALLFQLLSLTRWMQNNNVTVVHFHKSTDLRVALLMGWLLPDLKLVFTEHMNAKKSKKSPYHRLVYGRLDQVISISDFTLANNLSALPVRREKICRLYSGIDLERFCPSLAGDERLNLRNQLGLTSDTFALCLPGRLTPGKGHEVFVDAFALLLQKSSLTRPVKAFIVGGLTLDKGADEAFVELLQNKIQDMGLTEHVTFTGYTTEMQRLLQAMDAVCVPSRVEAFGLAVVEAMALGVPVVGSNSGAIPEILGCNGEYGLLAQPDDAQSYAASFERLMSDDDLCEKISQRALERVRSVFDLRHHVQALQEIYGI